MSVWEVHDPTLKTGYVILRQSFQEHSTHLFIVRFSSLFLDFPDQELGRIEVGKEL